MNDYDCAHCSRNKKLISCAACRRLANKSDEKIMWYRARVGKEEPYGSFVSEGVKVNETKKAR